MWRNYLVVALRSLKRNPLYTFINLFGLALAITVGLLITLFLHDEWSHDRHWPGHEQLYRIVTRTWQEGAQGAASYNNNTTPLFASSLRGAIPGIESMTRTREARAVLLRTDNRFLEERAIYVEPEFFGTFGQALVAGNPDEALNELSSVLISRDLAKRLFGGDDPLGRTIEAELLDALEPVTVRGVFEAPPRTSSIQYDLIANYEVLRRAYGERMGEQWGLSWSETYARLAPGASVEDVEAAMDAFLAAKGYDTISMDEGNHRGFRLQPVDQMHVSLTMRHLPTETEPTASLVLAGIGLVILLIAAINVTGLAIGRGARRSREVGVRKVLGASQTHVRRQFWVENAVLVLMAIALGTLGAELALPVFNRLADADLTLEFTPFTLLALFGFWIGVTVLAGLYPTLVISRFGPVAAFRGSLKVGGKTNLRRGLVFVQFSLSIALIAITLVMHRQLQFIQSRDLGFRGEQVVSLPAHTQDNTGKLALERMKGRLLALPGVTSVSGSACSMDTRWFDWSFNTAESEEHGPFSGNVVDFDYLQTLGLKLVAGRSFSPDHPSDAKRAIVVNEAFVEYWGWEDPLGRQLGHGFPDHRVIGVVENFHYNDLRQEIQPLMLMMDVGMLFNREGGIGFSARNWWTIQEILVRLQGEDIPGTMRAIEGIYQDALPDRPFEYAFLDEQVGEQYEMEKRQGTVVSYAAGFAVAIALLGLFGLSTLEVAQRTKEIGIRKVLGASEGNLVLLLSREIILLVLAANLVAWPAAWVLSRRWLRDFAYQAGPGFWTLALAGFGALLLAWATVSVLAWRAARANPVNSLRYE